MAGELRRVGVIELRLDDSKLRPAQVGLQQQVERTTSSFNGLRGVMSKLKPEQVGVQQQVERTTSSFDGLRGVMAAIGGVAAVHLAAGMVRSSAATENAAASFAALTRDADGATATLDALRRGTAGATREVDLLVAANTAMLMGMPRSAAAMGELAEASRVLGRATGRTAAEAFNDIAIGIGRQSRLILDNIGLVVDADLAYKSFAKSIGKTTQELTVQEQKAGFYAAAMEQVRIKVASLPEVVDSAADKLGRLGAQFDRIKTGAGSLLGSLLISPSGTGESLVGEAAGIGLGALAGSYRLGAAIGSLIAPGFGTLAGAGLGALGGLIIGSLSESRGVQITQNVQMDGAGRHELEILSAQTNEAARQIRNLERR